MRHSPFKVLITAGPTREFFDPIRFLSNPSSARMGFEIARSALREGMDVTLISGPTTLEAPRNLKFIRVVSAQEMFNAVKKYFHCCDALIMTAAVSDYKPKVKLFRKFKKGAPRVTVELIRNQDILAWAGKNKKKQFLAGFAAETDHVIENGLQKLKSKNLDLLVANQVGTTREGFESSKIKAAFLSRNKCDRHLSVIKKTDAAQKIINIMKEGMVHGNG